MMQAGFFGSSAEQITLKEDGLGASFLEQLLALQQDPTETIMG